MDAGPIASTGRAKRVVFIALIALALFAVLELVAFAGGKFLQHKYHMYVEPVPQVSDTVKSYADYLRVRDPRLGWPFPVNFGQGMEDASGARNSPAFPDPAKVPNSIAIFGDSFATGSEVDDDHAWGNQLALSTHSRVASFGAPGYGTDQAYLRFLSLDKDPSRIVILTHLSEGIERNLTRDWDLITGERHYGLKPRFALDRAGNLREVPLPNLSEHDYLRSVAVESPFLPMEDENFQPGGPLGVTRLTFPFTIALLRNLGAFQMRALIARRPAHAEFYDKDHPLHGLQISAKILEAFQAEAKKRGKIPLVILIANVHDIKYVRNTGKWTYANLVDELNRNHVDYVDFGPILLRHMGNRDGAEFFKPLGHYNEDVNKLLADTAYNALKDRGALPH